MLVPINWMEEYVPGADAERDEVAERMVMSGSNIESVRTYGDGTVEKVVLGRILEVWAHPDSDHLVVCRVDIGAGGGGAIQIVTGAPNVASGDFVPVALHGATLPGGTRIKKGKLRGEVSDGMLCSAQELGFDEKVVPLACKDGIWILPPELRQEALLGKNIFEALGLTRASVIDFEITPNRPDCLSIYGLAAEYAAVFALPLEPVPTLEPEAEDAGYPAGERSEDYIRVSIAQPEHCYRYIARIATDVEIKESPWWLQKKLMLAGMRPINNIVDITNYVMLEIGHPIHAFDMRRIESGEIRVDTAREGERFTTLDGAERALYEDTLLIKDGERGVAVAGVMGGLNSEIEPDTKMILIEAASFSPDSVRRTSKKLGLRTEASSRYEKGVPAELSKLASDRVCQLIALTGAGTVLAGAADCYPARQEVTPIPVRASRVNRVLGTSLSAHAMAELLSRLGIGTETDGAEGEAFTVTPPFRRLDLKEEIDIVEEIARIYGYDKLEPTVHSDNITAGVSKSRTLRGRLRDLLTGFGLSEIQNYSFVSPSGVSLISADGDPELTAFVKLINPLGEENSVMRTTLLPGLIETLTRNYNRSARECRLFEIGNIFKNHPNEEGLPTESISLCVGAYGGGVDFYYLKGVAEEIFESLGLAAPSFERASDVLTFHPGRCARVHFGFAETRTGETACPPCVGVIGELHPDVADRFGVGERVVCMELDFDRLAESAVSERVYTPMPKYPAVLRDIALLVKDDVLVGTLLEIIKHCGGRLLESAELFDVYRGKQVPEGLKSLAFGLTFRSSSGTLTDDDAQKALTKILKGLSDETGAALRDS